MKKLFKQIANFFTTSEPLVVLGNTFYSHYYLFSVTIDFSISGFVFQKKFKVKVYGNDYSEVLECINNFFNNVVNITIVPSVN